MNSIRVVVGHMQIVSALFSMTMMVWHTRMRKDRSAGIEGLPLQLMLMVLVAGIGTAVMIGWMGGLQAPQAIGAVHASTAEIILSDDDGDGLYRCDDLSLTITVVDQKGDGLSGATIVLEGSGITDGDHKVHGTTDSSGQVSFSGLSSYQSGRTVGFVTVTATKSGYGQATTLTIPVISE
jgi:hypothetical protein